MSLFYKDMLKLYVRKMNEKDQMRIANDCQWLHRFVSVGSPLLDRSGVGEVDILLERMVFHYFWSSQFCQSAKRSINTTCIRFYEIKKELPHALAMRSYDF